MSADAFLADHLPRIRAVVSRLAPEDADVEDLIQEALIEVARVAEAKPDAPVAYLYGVARLRARHLLTEGRRWTGYEAKRGGQPIDPLRRSDRGSLDGVDTEHPADDLNVAEWSVLGVEIEAAVATLAPRQAELTRAFMGGASIPEAALDMGVKPDTARTEWSSIRPRLRTQLSHLEGLVR